MFFSLYREVQYPSDDWFLEYELLRIILGYASPDHQDGETQIHAVS